MNRMWIIGGLITASIIVIITPQAHGFGRYRRGVPLVYPMQYPAYNAAAPQSIVPYLRLAAPFVRPVLQNFLGGGTPFQFLQASQLQQVSNLNLEALLQNLTKTTTVKVKISATTKKLVREATLEVNVTSRTFNGLFGSNVPSLRTKSGGSDLVDNTGVGGPLPGR